MSASFASQLRARPGAIRLGEGEPRMTVRVQVPEVWDIVRVDAAAAEPVLALKNAALAVLMPRADHRDYVIKLRGFEVLDEGQSLVDEGALDGSTFLLSSRRRRPVR